MIMGRLSHSTEADIAWRLDLGQSPAEVAAACGVSVETVRRREQQSGASLDFPPWIVRQTRAIQDGWTEQEERDRRAQQPDRPEFVRAKMVAGSGDAARMSYTALGTPYVRAGRRLSVEDEEKRGY